MTASPCRFKLHLRPQVRGSKDDEIPPLPPNKTVIQVFADYMKYLLQCSHSYISDTHGVNVWESLKDDIMFVLTHPNGWGGPQQAKMREAAIRAGLVPGLTRARADIAFVTEGEASLHFCLSNGLDVPTSDEDVRSGSESLSSTCLLKAVAEVFRCSHCRRWWRNYRYHLLPQVGR